VSTGVIEDESVAAAGTLSRSLLAAAQVPAISLEASDVRNVFA
jgi:hypothetical protein